MPNKFELSDNVKSWIIGIYMFLIFALMVASAWIPKKIFFILILTIAIATIATGHIYNFLKKDSER